MIEIWLWQKMPCIFVRAKAELKRVLLPEWRDRMRKIVPWMMVAMFCFGVKVPEALAQELMHHDDDMASHEDVQVGYIPREVLQLPIALRDGIGFVNDPVTTKNPEAQAFYNQGEAYLHSYVWIEAARSFNQALRLDPQLVMAHVGLFRVFENLDDLPAAEQELKKAQVLESGVTERERRRIALTAKHLEALQDLRNKAKHDDYKRAIESALNANPDDVELWLLRGNAEEAAANGRGQVGRAGSIAFYEAALARSPDNFAAHHYLIHSYEGIGRNDEAAKHGEFYAHFAANIPHAHHMWGHDLRLIGKVDEAVQQFEIADQLERNWYKNDGIDPSLDWHRPHNLDLLSRSLQHDGQMKEAEKYIREAMELTPKVSYAGYRQKMLPDFLIARGRNEEALAAARAIQKSEWPLGRFAGHALAGRVLLVMNRVEDGQKELAAAEKEVPEARKSFTGVVTFERIAGDQLSELKGEVLVRTGQTKQGDELLRQTASSLASHRGADALEELYLLEHIARMAREQQRWDLAKDTAQMMMEFDPNYFGAHYAVAAVAEHDGDDAKARQEMATAKQLWGHADPGLAELKQIESKLSHAGK
jgi:tetratricopeptide (TPR) repeat protein